MNESNQTTKNTNLAKKVMFINLPMFLIADTRLKRSALILAGFFHSLYMSHNSIKVSNAYLAELLSIDERHVRDNLKLLEDSGYIKRELKARTRIIHWVFSPGTKVAEITDNEQNEQDFRRTTASYEGDANVLLRGTQTSSYNKVDNKVNKNNINKGNPDFEKNVPSNPQPQTQESTKKLEPVEYQETYYEQPKKLGSLTESSKEDGFEEFWELYPVKKSEKGANLVWVHENLCEQKELILSKLKEQIAKDTDWKAGYIPWPKTYLTYEHWRDEIRTTGVRSGNNGKAPQGSYFDNSTKWAEKLLTR